MYASGEQIFQDFIGTDGRPRQKRLDEQEDLFLFTYAKMLLHRHLREERILSPYANPFYPITDINHIETEIRTERAQKRKDITKEDIASNLQVKIEAIKLATERKTKEEPWTEVTKGAKHEKKPDNNEETEKKDESNMYKVLRENGIDEMDKRSRKDEQQEKKTSEKVKRRKNKRSCNVNEMKIEEINEIIEEQKEKDVYSSGESSRTEESEEVESEVMDDGKCKTKEALANEIERVRYQNMLMIGRLEQAEEKEIGYEKRIKRLETTLKENETNVMKKNLDAQNQEEEKELILIQEVVEKTTEALLGNMTEAAFEIADVLEETDENITAYKNDNDELRQKLRKSIDVIKEKNEEIDEWIEEAESLSTKNEELEKEIASIKRQYELEKKINEIMRKEMKLKGNRRTGRS